MAAASSPQSDPPPFRGPAPPWFRSYMLGLLSWIAGHRIIAGNGVQMEEASGGGKVIHVDGSIVAGAGRKHPYEVYAGATGSSVVVNNDSWCKKGPDMDANISVDGVGTEIIIDPGDDLYYYIWAEAVINDGEIDEVNIEYGPSAGLWDDYPAPVRIDAVTDPSNPKQDRAYQMIAYLRPKPDNDPYPERRTVSKDGTTYQIVQCVHTNLELFVGCYDDMPGSATARNTVLLFGQGFAPSPGPGF